MNKSWYIHTLNGHPAFYDQAEKMLFFAHDGQTSLHGRRPLLVPSLAQIRKEQEQNRLRLKGLDIVTSFGYLRVRKD